MTSKVELLHKCTTFPISERRQVNLPTENVVSVSHMGCTIVVGDHVNCNALFVPDFKCNLLSVLQLTKELNFVAISSLNYVFYRISPVDRSRKLVEKTKASTSSKKISKHQQQTHHVAHCLYLAILYLELFGTED